MAKFLLVVLVEGMGLLLSGSACPQNPQMAQRIGVMSEIGLQRHTSNPSAFVFLPSTEEFLR